MNAHLVQNREFYAHGETESGRCRLSALKSHEAVLIERFVDGQCTGADHRQLVAFLLSNPEWISWIASRVNDGFESSHQHGRKGYFLVSAA